MKSYFWLLLGVAGAIGCIIGGISQPVQFFRSWLFSVMLCMQLSLGALAIWMMHELVQGRWTKMLRPALAGGAMTLPWMGLLFIPVLAGQSFIYPWTDEAFVQSSKVMQHKAVYLNETFFTIRSMVYLFSWMLIAWLLWRWTSGGKANKPIAHPVRRLAAFGLIWYGLSMTFSSVDWVMSLEPKWFSTMYGFLWIAEQGPAIISFLILITFWKERGKPFELHKSHYQDLGNLLMTFLLIWAYISFFQFLLIWAGNTEEFIPWYITRSKGGWKYLMITLAMFHFILPFVALIFRYTKRNLKLLTGTAVIVLVAHFGSVFWLIKPAFHKQGFHFHWLDVVSMLTVTGVWMWAFMRKSEYWLKRGGYNV